MKLPNRVTERICLISWIQSLFIYYPLPQHSQDFSTETLQIFLYINSFCRHTYWCFSSFSASAVRYLKPDIEKKSKHKTAVMKRTLNPEFNEVRSPQLLPSAERQLCPHTAVLLTSSLHSPQRLKFHLYRVRLADAIAGGWISCMLFSSQRK